MKTLIAAVAMTALMSASVAFAEETVVSTEQSVQSTEATEVSAFEGVDSSLLSAEEMKTAASAKAAKNKPPK
jgi:uncharacterized cupredoxin-like copper-binding protein